MMRKLLFIIYFILNISFLNAYSIVESTFENIYNINDNNLSTFATSKSLKIGEQYIVINLKKRRYVSGIEINWRKEFYPDKYKILGSTDYINWRLLKIVKGKKKNINLNNKVIQFLKIYIPQDIKSKKNIFKINEIKFKFASNLKPEIKDIRIEKINKYSVTIKWNTDIETIGQIRYGRDLNDINNIKTEYFYTDNHQLTLDKLLKGTKYYYQIINLTAENKIVTTPVKFFKTKGTPLPEIKSVKIKKYYNGVDLTVEANVKVKIEIKYGKDVKGLTYIKKENSYSKIHILQIRNLIPLNKYYYEITVIDKKRNKYKKAGFFSTGEYNIALNKKVRGTFYNKYIGDVFKLKGDVLSNATDGDFSYSSGMAVSFDPAISDQYLIVDLEKIKKVERIITYWRALAYPYFYFILYSNDGKKWNKIKKIVKLKGKKIVHIKNSGIPLIIGDTPVNIETRYIKIFIPKGTPYYKKYHHYKFLQLVEIKIYGKYEKN